MIRILFATLLLCSVSFGQSITVSGGRSSFIISGKGTPQKGAEKPQGIFVPVPVEKPVGSVPVKPQPGPAAETQRQWYLVSESWCSHCPAAKARFRAKGWPERNVLTIAQCEQKFGFRPPHVPFEFGEPTGTTKGTVITVDNPAATYRTPSRQRLPVVNTPWGRQDLETYEQSHRGCNCAMCQGVRAIINQYRYQTMSLDLPREEFGQEPTPAETITQMLDLMQLDADDVLCDLGCGDGRILIDAAIRFGCKGIGVEIDKAKADEALRTVKARGLQGQIRIIHGDALEFSPQQHSVSALVTYLYPDLLRKLAPKFATVRVGASPFHEVPGIGMVKNGDVWIYRKAVKADYQLTSQPIARVQQTGCKDGNCPAPTNRAQRRRGGFLRGLFR